MSQQTYMEVQAALLNSSDEPKKEIASALAAVANFADSPEVELTLEGWRAACETAWHNRG